MPNHDCLRCVKVLAFGSLLPHRHCALHGDQCVVGGQLEAVVLGRRFAEVLVAPVIAVLKHVAWRKLEAGRAHSDPTARTRNGIHSQTFCFLVTPGVQAGPDSGGLTRFILLSWFFGEYLRIYNRSLWLHLRICGRKFYPQTLFSGPEGFEEQVRKYLLGVNSERYIVESSIGALLLGGWWGGLKFLLGLSSWAVKWALRETESNSIVNFTKVTRLN